MAALLPGAKKTCRWPEVNLKPINTMSDATPPRLNPRKIYLKDASFESPASPKIFLRTEMKPDIDLNINVKFSQIDDNAEYFEVVLQVTATATQNGESMFLAEIHQAGVFEITAEDEEHRALLIQIGCPNMLLPFAREELASMVSKGGFPQVLMNPVNF